MFLSSVKYNLVLLTNYWDWTVVNKVNEYKKPSIKPASRKALAENGPVNEFGKYLCAEILKANVNATPPMPILIILLLQTCASYSSLLVNCSFSRFDRIKVVSLICRKSFFPSNQICPLSIQSGPYCTLRSLLYSAINKP